MLSSTRGRLSLLSFLSLLVVACQEDLPGKDRGEDTSADTDGDTGSDTDTGGDSGGTPVPQCEPAVQVDAGDIVEDDTEEPGGCLAEVSYDAECDEKVYGVRVTGRTDGAGEDPGAVTIKSPGACNGHYNHDDAQRSGADDIPTGTSGDEWQAEAADKDVCDDAATDVGNDLTCNSATQARYDRC